MIHRFEPDGITDGLIQELGWTAYLSGRTVEADIVALPEGSTVLEIAQHLKERLGIHYVRIAGNLEIVCKRVAVLVGFRGNALSQFVFFRMNKLICSLPEKDLNGKHLNIFVMLHIKVNPKHLLWLDTPKAKPRV